VSLAQKSTESKMDGLNKNVDANMDGLKTSMEYLNKYLTKFLQ